MKLYSSNASRIARADVDLVRSRSRSMAEEVAALKSADAQAAGAGEWNKVGLHN